MFGLRSARGRAVLATAVLILVLVVVAIVVGFRVRQHQEQLLTLEDTAASVATLEHTRAQLFLELAALSSLAVSDDPAFLDLYQEAAAGMEQDLSKARAEAVATGKADHVAALDDLTERIGNLNQTTNATAPVLARAAPEARVQLTSAAMPEMWAEVSTIVVALDQLALEEQTELAAERATASDAAAVTSWIVVGFGGVALLVATGMVIATIASVIGPLVSLRATARAITSGDLESRARVSGPEEVASVACAFNEMTDALAAKTKEYIDTTNLTGDMIVRLDKDGRFTFLNDAACQSFGRSREELLGTDAAALMHPEDLEQASHMVQEVIGTKGLARGFVSRLATPTGTKVLDWNGCPLFDEEGQYAGIQITARDISERKQMEESVTRTEQRYRTLFEEAPVMYVIVRDQEGVPIIGDCNELFLSTLGYTRAEVLERPLADFYTPQSRAELLEGGGFQRGLEGRLVGEERELLTRDGRVVRTLLRALPETDPEGSVFGTRAMYVDISERKQMEEALSAKTEEYVTVTNLTGEIIAKVDEVGRWTFLNDAACQFYGRSREELLGADSRDCIHPEDLEPTVQAVQKSAATGEAIEGFVNRQVTPMGTRVMEWNASPLFDEEGRYAGIQMTGRDITERKKAEEGLRESEEKYRRLVQDSTDGIMIVQGIETQFANRALLKMYGTDSEEDMVGRPFTDFVSPEHRELMVERAGARQAGERVPTQYEFKALRKDGTDFDAEISVSKITYQGKPAVQGIVRDITERKKAEEALRESEERYRLIAENSSDVIWTTDLNFKYTYVSPSVTRLRGYSVEEVMAGTLVDTLSPASLAVARKVLAAALAEDRERAAEPFESRTLELELNCKDGSTVWTEIIVTFLRDSDGQPVGLLGVSRDISERKRMEDALAAKTKEYVDTTNLTGDIIAKLDKHGNWVFLNDAACRFYGKPREELLGIDSRALVHPDDLEATAESIREARTRNELVTGFVNRQLTPMGTRVVEWDGYPIFDDEGQYAGIQITGHDITQRKQMEEALRESEARYRLLAENTSDLIWTMDMSLRYTYMSPSVTRMRGYTVEEVVGSTVTETMTPASIEVARKALAEELAMERMADKDPHRSRKVEFEMYCKDGSTIWTEMNMTFLRDPEGKPIGILGVTRDISERKKAEEEREKLNAELEVRAITDSLTGLYDHAHFYQRLAEEIERSKRYKHGFALLLMDVDDFKRFNESRGHKAGDEILRLVAHCIPAGLRRSDLAFRYGGDEFAAILPHADTAKARIAVDRINRRITMRLEQMDGGPGTRLTLTAGVACFPDDGTTADELVRIADATLYNAKWVARAHDIMGQKEDIQSLVSALVSRQGGVDDSENGAVFHPEALHEQQARIVSSVASSIAVALKDAGVAQALEDPDLQVLATVGAAAEIKDRYIRGHPERMSEWAVALAEEMGLSPERVRDICIAALLHDIGKVTVSEGILNKPGKLTRREFASIKDHPIVGATLVSQVKGFERVVPIVRHHHERFDGTGYPDGLAGEDIPPESRILSVLDVFDALTHERSYRKAQGREEALAMIEGGAGTQFDPVVVKAFLALVKRGGDGLRAPARAASEDRQLAVATKAAGRRKG